MLPVPISGARWPSSGVASYGYQRSPTHKHQGVDIAAPVGTPIWSVFAGTVETSAPPGTKGFDGLGRVLVVRRADDVRAAYAHLERALVNVGDHVAEGQQIATVGTSRGTVADPNAQFARSRAHLHFEASRTRYPLRRDRDRIDPLGVEPMPEPDEQQRGSIERWHTMNRLILKLYESIPMPARTAEVDQMLADWREAYARAPQMGQPLRGAALSDWITKYNEARKRVAAAGISVGPAVRDVGVAQDVSDAVDAGVDAVKDAAATAGGWVLVAALAYLWWQSEQKKQTIQIEMVGR